MPPRRAARLAVGLLIDLAAGTAPAGATDLVAYAGRMTLERGAPSCAARPDTALLEVGSDGGIRGSLTTEAGTAMLFGTVTAAGRLTASLRAAAGAEYTQVEGVFADGHFTGTTRSRSCRDHLDLTRRGEISSEEK